MATQPQIQANRLNAQKSTGPKTQQGKAVASQNAIKHGLSATHDVIITESQEAFDRHRDSLVEELAPQTKMEAILADRIVSLSWRLKRAEKIQNQTFDAIHEKNINNPLRNLAKSLGLKALPTPHPETTDSNPNLTLGRIALKDFANERVLDRLLMYERRIENSLHKTILELQRLTLIREVRATPSGRPPDANPVHPTQNDRPNPTNSPEPPPQRARSVSAGVLTDQNSTTAPQTPPSPRLAVVATTTHPPQIHSSAQEPPPPNQKPQPFSTNVEPPRQIAPNYPRAYEALPQNKPNPKNPKNTATSYATQIYTNIPPHSARKNKPNQTQFITAKPKAKPDSTTPQHDIPHTKLSVVPIYRGCTSTSEPIKTCRMQISK